MDKLDKSAGFLCSSVVLLGIVTPLILCWTGRQWLPAEESLACHAAAPIFSQPKAPPPLCQEWENHTPSAKSRGDCNKHPFKNAQLIMAAGRSRPLPILQLVSFQMTHSEHCIKGPAICEGHIHVFIDRTGSTTFLKVAQLLFIRSHFRLLTALPTLYQFTCFKLSACLQLIACHCYLPLSSVSFQSTEMSPAN